MGPSHRQTRKAPEENPLLPHHPQPPSTLSLIILVSTITIGSHYSKHSLSSLSPEIISLLQTSRTEYGLLFSSQQLPGVVIPILGGLALTYIPLAPAAIVFTSCITFATILCAIAISNQSYSLLLLGRLIFGLCDGALTTLQGTIIARSFRHRVGAGYGAMLCVSRLSSFAGLTIPAAISTAYSLQISMWTSAIICLPSLLSTIIYARTINASATNLSRDHPTDITGISRIITSLTIPFWAICYLWAVVASDVFSLTHFLPDIMQQHFGMSSIRSGFLGGSLLLAAAVTSPILGIFQDRIGRRATIMTLCCTLLTAGFVLCATAITGTKFLALPHYLFYVALLLIALSFCAAPVTLLGCIAVVVDETFVPAALGIYKALENAALAVFHIAVGAARDWTGEYTSSFLLLAALSLSAMCVALLLTRETVLQERCPEGQTPDFAPNDNP